MVVEVLLRGTDWAPNVASLSIALDSSDQLTTLPITNINQVSIRFSAGVLTQRSDLLLTGSTSYALSDFVYDPATFTATWTVDTSVTPLGADRLLISLNALTGGVRDVAGNSLDGDGNGVGGDNFQLRVNVLPGDVSGDGVVNFGDALMVLNLVPSVSSDNLRADINADGIINMGDALRVLGSVGTTFPAPPSAQTIQVSPTGSDTGDGSAQNPLATILAAVSLAQPGDTILVADGSYQGFTVRDVHGTSAKPITIKAAGEKVVIVPTTPQRAPERGAADWQHRDTIYVTASSYIVIDSLQSSGAHRAAVRVDSSDHVTVRNGIFGQNAKWGIFTNHSDDLLIENNVAFGSGKEHGIYVSNSGDRPIIRGNTVSNNNASGIQLNADLSAGGDGIITGALIENNIIYGNGRAGGAAINLDGVEDSTVRNNVLYDNHASGITNFQYDGAQGPRGMEIYNNTIVMASDARWALLIHDTTGVNRVRNNILVNLNSNRGGIDYGTGSDINNTDSAYNIFGGAVYVTPDDWTSRITLPNWQAQGHEPHSFTATLSALFVNPNQHDYHLLATSPAIDAGTNLLAPTKDADGKPRPNGNGIDIGAYE